MTKLPNEFNSFPEPAAGPTSKSYTDSLPPLLEMTIAFVGEAKNIVSDDVNCRLFAVQLSTYAGRNDNGSVYNSIDIVIYVLNTERWERFISP